MKTINSELQRRKQLFLFIMNFQTPLQYKKLEISVAALISIILLSFKSGINELI